MNLKRNIIKAFLVRLIGTQIWTSNIEVIQLKRKKNMRKTWQDQAYTFLRERAEFNERKRQMVWQGKHRPIKMF